MLDKEIKEIFYNGGLNCAESFIRLYGQQEGLNIPPELIKTMTGFGGGMQRGLTCGAVTAAVAIIGYYKGRTEPWQSREDAVRAVGEYLEGFEEKFDSLLCSDLIADCQFNPEEKYRRCSVFIVDSVKMVKQILADQEDQIKE